MEILPLDRKRLSELVDLWNQELGSRFPMREELFKQNSFNDENVLLSGTLMALNEKGEVDGFIICKRWQESLEVNMSKQIGWIQVLLVRETARGQGVGSALLSKAESALKQDGATEILLGRDPWHYFPGIPAEDKGTADWFEQKGYASFGDDYDLVAEYDADEEPMKPDLNGIEITLLTLEEREAFLAFMKRVFPGRWEYEAVHYFKKGGTGREFVLLKKAGDIIGFCRINDGRSPMIAQNVYWAPLYMEELGGVGPLGVDAAERGNGYGLAVVRAGIYYLRDRNIDRIVIDWTGLTDFYGKLGYEVWKGYKKYRKNIADDQLAD